MNTEDNLLLEALQKQIEALKSRLEAYKIQNEALLLHNEALTIQLEDCKIRLEDCMTQLEDYKIRLEDCKSQLEEKIKYIEDLNYKINKSEIDKKIKSDKEKIFNYLLEKVKTFSPKRKTQQGTLRWIVKLAEYMLENETVKSEDIKAHFGITRNTQWRYLQYIRPLGYFKYSFKDRIPVFTITQLGIEAKEEIKRL